MFQNLRVSVRLGLGFGALMALLLILAGYGIVQMARINGHLREIVNQDVRREKLLNQIQFNFRNSTGTMYDTMLKSDWSAARKAVLQANHASTNRIMLELHAMPMSAQSADLLKHVETLLMEGRKFQEAAIQLMSQDLYLQAVPVFTQQYLPIVSQIRGDLERLSALQDAKIQKAYESSEQDYRTARMLGFGFSFAALALAIFIATWITRSLTRQLGGEPAEVARLAQAIAAGDLSIGPASSGVPVNSVMDAVYAMRAKLLSALTTVRAAADNLSSASTQVSSTSQSLSQSASEQAASVEETSATLEQATASIKQNADNARLTDTMAQQASSQAREGGAAVQQTVAAMQSIAERISIIDDIAYQTNM
ncbi:MAG: MCP four helix bundle domain-containing protein, partial [Thiomonas delicata]